MNGVNAMAERFRRSGWCGAFSAWCCSVLPGSYRQRGVPWLRQRSTSCSRSVWRQGLRRRPCSSKRRNQWVNRYTVYDAFDPVRVVVDFPGMAVAAVPETIVAGPAPLKELRLPSLTSLPAA